MNLKQINNKKNRNKNNHNKQKMNKNNSLKKTFQNINYLIQQPTYQTLHFVGNIEVNKLMLMILSRLFAGQISTELKSFYLQQAVLLMLRLAWTLPSKVMIFMRQQAFTHVGLKSPSMKERVMRNKNSINILKRSA